MEEQPRLRVAMVGAGHISAQHAPAWVTCPDADLVAICDLDRARAENRRAQVTGLGGPNVGLFTDVATMLRDVKPDCVDLITRPDTHAGLVAMAASAGIHVLCQKPLAASLDEARSMVDTCQKSGVRFIVTEMWRFLPWFRDVKRMVDEGAIGPAHYLRIIGPRMVMLRQRPVHDQQPYFADMPRLIVYEMYIHWIDCARNLLGEIETVYARAGRVNPAIIGEDWAVLLNGHVGGATSLVESSWANSTDSPTIRREGDILLEGAEGALHFDPTTLTLRLIRPDEITTVAQYDSLDRAFQQAFDACLGHFARAVRLGEPFESPADDNLKTLAATLAAYDSLERKAAVEVRYDA
jgi:predicted dehydrogenase